MAKQPKSAQEREARAGFAQELGRLQAVFAGLPSDLALPYLDALDKMRDEKKVAAMAASWLRARAQKKRTSAQVQKSVDARVAEYDAQAQQQKRQLTAEERDARRLAVRDWLAARMARHGTNSEQAHRHAVNAAQNSTRGAT